MKLMLGLALLACGPALAQSDVLAALNFDHLRSKAKESVDVSVDASTLKVASRYVSGKENEEKSKKLLKLLESGLNGIYVRSFEFDRDGQYAESDLKPVRALLKAPGWARIIGVNESNGESAEVWMRTENGRSAGMCIIAADKRELTIVYLDGPVKLDDLAELGGSFGIPAVKGKK